MEFVIGIGSSLATTAVKYTIAPIKNQIKYLFNHENKVESLKDQVESLRDARDRVQHSVDAAKGNGEQIEHDVDKWLTTVDKKIDEEVEKVIQDEEKAKKKCFLGLCPSFWTRYKLSLKAEEEVKAVAELLEQGKFDRVSYRVAPQTNIMMAISVKGFEEFESRRLVLNGIMEALKDASIKVIGVHGMGGVGKTMLVKEVARQAKEGRLFDSVVIATVTQTLDVEKIQNQIADLLGLKYDVQSIVGRALQLRARLNEEEKILVVLDDIWDGLDLEEVGIPIGNENEGCKILLTSRDLNVLLSGMDTQKNFAVGVLKEEEAWNLFKKMAGDCVESGDLQPTAVEVAKKCAGLPIAIATFARALRNKALFEWENALSELKRPSSGNFTGVTAAAYSAIELSYNYLESDEVKLTFLLCSLIGHNGLIQDLLKYIIGLGWFQGVYTIKEARNKVLTVVSKLKASCLLLDSYNNERFDIHDVVLGVALSIASRDNSMFVLRDGDELKEWPDKERMNNCFAINLCSPRFITELPDKMEGLHLSFFRVDHIGSVKIPANFFQQTERLKVIDFNGVHFRSLPVSVNHLTKLRTLCLDQCVLEDISSIGKLKSLEILSLCQSDIKALPREIAQLTQLKLLNLSRTKLKIIPPNVLSNLFKLEELYMEDSFVQWEEEVPGSESRNASLEELKHLTHLTTLHAHIPNAQIIPERLFMETLDRYRIFIGDYDEWDWSNRYEYSRTLKLKLYTSIYLDHGVKILLKKTEELFLAQLKGIKNVLDEFDNGEDFPHLKKLHIQNGLEVQYIATEKIKFSQLQSMTLQNLPQLVSFSSEGRRCSISQQEQGDTSTKPLFNKQIVFPELKSLQLSSIKTQMIWHKQFSETCCSFPKLKSLIIQGCGNLEHLLLPSVARGLLQLEHFEIVECKWLREIIFSEEMEEGKKDVMCFPKLKFLQIRDLYNLIRFCSGNYAIEFPSLKVLNIKHCPKLKEFTNETKIEGNYQSGVQALFNEKAAAPSLQRMTISYLRNVKMIFHNKLLAGSFCKLEEMRVDNCHQLLTIFPSTIIRAFHSLEKLRVSKCDSVEYIFELAGFNIEETIYSSLRELEIFSLPALKHVWNNNPLGISIFRSLCKVNAHRCPSLKNLFPVSIAKDLSQLEYLNISSCGLEEIVSAGEGLEQPIRFKFPQMSFLELSYLNELKCFYPGQHTIVWPTLKNLRTDYSTLLRILASEHLSSQEMNGNGQRDSNIGQRLFLVEEVIPKLEQLQLQKLKDITMMCDGQFLVDLFHQIKVFEVYGFPRRSASFPISFFQRFYNLEIIQFFGCDFKDLVSCEGDVGAKPADGTILSRIRKLKFKSCRNLTNIGKKDTELGRILHNLQTLEVLWCHDLINFGSFSSFSQNLTTLEVQRCDLLKNLATPSVAHLFRNLTTLKVLECNKMINLVTPLVAQSLVQLTAMTITDCCAMTEIVANEEDGVTSEINFSKLQYLKLDCLQNLASFCSGNHTFTFPGLEELIVKQCPTLKVFCEGVLSTPQLQRVKESGDHDRGLWAGDLNTTMQLFYTQKVGYRGLHSLTVSDEFPELMEIWNMNPQEILDFKNLREIEICNCSSLKYIFTLSAALSLKRLFTLKIKECGTMEEVIRGQGAEEEGTTDKVTFLSLYSIKIESCSNLTCFYLGSGALEFPSLDIIRIFDCPKMTIFASSFSRNKERMWIIDGSERRLGQTDADPNMAPTFFSHKVVCPKLNFLELSSINIEKIWDLLQPASHLYAQNLERLTIKGCLNLKYLFPSFMVQHFVQLESLHISDCNTMEEVIVFMEGLAEEERTSHILFPKLKFLWLENLPKLTRFCYETHNEFPLLTSLNLKNCPALKTFITKSLIGAVGDDPQIDQRTQGNNLEVDKSALFNEKVVCPKLNFLELSSINIEKIWDLLQPASHLYAQNLERLTIKGCLNLKYLFPSFMVQHFVQLESLHISDCNTMEEVIVFMEGLAEEERTSHILFPKLKFLWLENLPKLTRFCYETHNEFPLLTSLNLKNCPVLKTFITKSLIGAVGDDPQIDQRTQGNNLEVDKPALFNEKVLFPSLKRLIIEGMSDCRKIWQDQLSVNSFSKLKFIRVEGCQTLLSIFPLNMMERLEELDKLHIVNCDSLEEIFEPQELLANESHSVTADQSILVESATKFVFPRITFLRLVKLPKLKGFYSRKHATEWPSLKRMKVIECQKLEIFASGCPCFGGTHAESQLQISNKQPLFWVDEV
ncbi:hypothetical protein PTKIN_Ptkin01aG0289600 [Pterospermum kingtungense]